MRARAGIEDAFTPDDGNGDGVVAVAVAVDGAAAGTVWRHRDSRDYRWSFDRHSAAPRLQAAGAGEILVVCGGVIPQQDYAFLKNAGVKAIFGPGTNIPLAAKEILELIRAARS